MTNKLQYSWVYVLIHVNLINTVVVVVVVVVVVSYKNKFA